MIEESLSPYCYPQGKFQDTLVDPEGQIIWQTPWQANLIVNGMRGVLANLVRGQGTSLTHWAVGRGDASWDNPQEEKPKDEERREWTNLKVETGRQKLSHIQLIESSTLQITANFTMDNIFPPKKLEDFQLREFGLIVGGNSKLNSGCLINHRIHARIDLQEGFTLKRTLRLKF
jgi:hypothetical protein